ncbi:hypothetical protein [Evansella clarkii]|uniref:hypothetical protein n=1 Tax=Evansella clarkii TaxID=79879 RepID=UPI000996752A|nr:hypothetical protein [Evansella clarkii]
MNRLIIGVSAVMTVFILGTWIVSGGPGAGSSTVDSESKEVTEQDLVDELRSLTITLQEGLDFDGQIGDIEIGYEEHITIHTLLDGSGDDTSEIAEEIKSAVESILEAKKQELMSDISLYKINIRDKDGKVIIE